MINFEHQKIYKKLLTLSILPDRVENLKKWIHAKEQIQFLEENSSDDEIVIYGSTKYIYIYCMVVPEGCLINLDKNDLLNWSVNPYNSRASYVWGGRNDHVWVEDSAFGRGSKILESGSHLIYGRDFEGYSGEEHNYFEVCQEYTHLQGIHWLSEYNAYCKFDELGDLKQYVTISKKKSDDEANLITFDRATLDQYLAASNQVLIRCFDFTLLDYSNFNGWGDEDEVKVDINESLFFKQKISGLSGYTRGIQIIKPSEPKQVLYSKIKGDYIDESLSQHVEFLTHDFRNDTVAMVSTDPKATTNFFEADKNDLPFELSPAFFRPEVLLKYKGDKEKYTVQERQIYCRATWFLKSYDVNEAGQVFAYICDLRGLPRSEKLHWQAHNEKPKTTISKRAYINDFRGEFVSFVKPLERIKQICREWLKKNILWWKLKNELLFDQLTEPISASRDEWAGSFLLLSQLVIEGFDAKSIKKYLEGKNIDFDKSSGSLSLLEKVINSSNLSIEAVRLDGLRLAQLIRTKVAGHSAKSDADKLARDAIKEHGSYSLQFNSICEIIQSELKLIEDSFK